MESQLRQRILLDRFSDISLADSISMRASSHQNRPKDKEKLTKIKKIFIITMMIIFLVYKVILERGQFECFIDRSHQVTSFLNRLSNSSVVFYNIISIVSQESIQFEVFILVIVSIMRMKNLQVHMFIALFYGFRALLLNLQKLPYPQGMISYQPIFPAFTVPYGITRDFYYSGHTGLMLISILFWRKLKYRKLQIISFILFWFVISVLIITRVHYIIDVIGSIIFTLWIDRYLLCHVKYFDYLFSCIYNAILWLYKYFIVAIS